MSESKKDWISTFWPLILLVVMGIVAVWLRFDLHNKETDSAAQHIRIVMLTDKNCNDCHLGASFVNLFNHPAVKGNDNVVTLMMDKAKIKRW